MRILLDHCVDRHIAKFFSAHEVKTAREMGWDGLQNGKLLAAAGTQFDVVMTVDQNLQYQQNPGTLPIAVVVLVGKSNKLSDLVPLIPAVEKALTVIKARTIVEVSL